MTISFVIPGKPPASSSANSRVSWHVRHTEGQRYMQDVLLLAQTATPEGHKPYTRCELHLVQKACSLRDADNFLGSFKPGLDGMVHAGLLVDDKPSVLHRVIVEHERVKKRTEECVIVTLKEVQE